LTQGEPSAAGHSVDVRVEDADAYDVVAD